MERTAHQLQVSCIRVRRLYRRHFEPEGLRGWLRPSYYGCENRCIEETGDWVFHAASRRVTWRFVSEFIMRLAKGNLGDGSEPTKALALSCFWIHALQPAWPFGRCRPRRVPLPRQQEEMFRRFH